jgi:ADP-ribose pyrophosphatase
MDSGEERYAHLVWTERARRKILDASVFALYQSRRESSDGRRGEFTVVESADWCNVVAPVDTEGGRSILLVRQFRHGPATLTVELPGGLVDPGEEPEQAARRELREETGYQASQLTLIGQMNPNPAFMTNTVYTFVADGALSAGSQSLDVNELADVELVPEDALLSLSVEEFNTHALMVAALHWYRLYRDDGMDYQSRVAHGSAVRG